MATLVIAAGQYVAANFWAWTATAALTYGVNALSTEVRNSQAVKRQGSQLDSSAVVTSVEGATIPRLLGRNRIAGQVMWQTKFREEVVTSTERVGGKGTSGQKVENTEYLYSCSFAVGLCESDGSARLGQIWADGKLLDTTNLIVRFYNGSETQLPDSKIQAVEGTNYTPAYRGLAYIVFEEFPLAEFGNRVPQITVEVINVPDDFQSDDSLQKAIKAVNLGPGLGEFAYATVDHATTETVEDSTYVDSIIENPNITYDAGIGYLPQFYTFSGNSSSINSNTGLEGTDFNVSMDQLEEAVENIASVAIPVAWFAETTAAATALVKPKVKEEREIITPTTWQVSGRTRLEVAETTLSHDSTPSDQSVRQAFQEAKDRNFRAMFVPKIIVDSGDYPEAAAITGTFSSFLGSAAPGDFGTFGGSSDAKYDNTIIYSSPTTWSYSRMILHYAKLLSDILESGDVFLVGSGLQGLSDDSAFGSSMVTLMNQVKTILPSGVLVSYGADWEEYKKSSLTAFWTAADFIGLNAYFPITDWRDGDETYTIAEFQLGIEGGEYYDYYYASESDRTNNVRTTITNAASRQKDFRAWRNSNHSTKEIWFTELGCPAVDKGGNQPDQYYDSRRTTQIIPYRSTGARNDRVQRLYVEAVIDYWDTDGLVDPADIFVTSWDVRPYGTFPDDRSLWLDANNWSTGPWLSGRLDIFDLSDAIRYLCLEAGLASSEIDVTELDAISRRIDGVFWDSITDYGSVIQNLSTTYNADMGEENGVLKFLLKDSSTFYTVDPDDFLVEDPTENSFSKTKEEIDSLPRETVVRHIDFNKKYQVSAVSGQNINTDAVNVETFSSIVIMDDASAKDLANILTQERWVQRDMISFSLPLEYKDLELGQNFTFDRRYKVNRLTFGDQIDVEASAYAAEVYIRSDDIDATTSFFEKVSFTGLPLLVVADLPLTDDTWGNLWSPRLVGRLNPWPGSINIYLSDGSGGHTLNTALSSQGIIGVLKQPLAKGPTNIWDNNCTVEVELFDSNQSLSSMSDISVLNGANALAVLTPSGEWEVLQFVNATLNGDGSYTLSRLLRGQLGTEYYMGDPTPAGNIVFLLDKRTAEYIAGTNSLLNNEVTIRHGPSNVPVGNDNYVDVTITPKGVAYRPYSPVHLRQKKSGNDIILNWVRRTRFDGDNWNITEIPLNEEFERYEIDIMNGATVVRTITVNNATTVTYTSAMQVSDFGSNQASIDWNIYQISTIFGRGTPGNG